MERRKRLGLVSAMVLVIAVAAGSAASPVAAKPSGTADESPWAVLVGPDVARFIPGTDSWKLSFRVVGSGWAGALPELIGAKVGLDGKTVEEARLEVRAGPWVSAEGLSEAQVREAKAAAAAEVRGRSPRQADLERFEATAGHLAKLMADVPASLIVLKGNSGAAEGEHWIDIALDYRLGGQTITVADQVQIIVSAIPRDPGWFSADLHLHSTFSDGNQSVAEDRADLTAYGYHIGYLTDHTSALIPDGVFDSLSDTYPVACQASSDTITSMFPGMEMQVGHDTWIGFNGDGHYLGYGIASTSGLDHNTWSCGTGIGKVDGNNPPLSSGSIAHPTHILYDWEDWTVLGYDGMELMSGYQWYFDVASGAVTRWRSECSRLQAYSGVFRPSVRSGSDYHSSWYTYVTHIRLPSDAAWYEGSWTGRWTAVSEALRDGRTAISRKGSLAYITADGLNVGSSVARASGSPISFEIHFRPILSGSYTLTLYQDDRALTVWTTSGSFTAGTPYVWTKTYTYPGSSHYYWLYVSGSDYGYTTPIYMHP